MKRKSMLPFVLFLFLTQPGWMQLPQQAPVIRACAYENAPKIFTDENGNVTGFWPDLLNSIAVQEGWQIEWVYGEWNDCLRWLGTNEIDILPDTGWTEARSQLYAFNEETVLISWTRLYAPEGSEITSILDLEGKTIAGLKGSFNLDGPEGIKDLTSQFGIHSTFIEMNNYTQVFEALERGEIDAGITNKDFGNLNENKYNVDRTAVIFQPARIQFALTQDAELTPYLIERIDSRLQELKADDYSVYYQALDNYLGEKASGSIEQVTPDWVKNLLWGAGGLILFLLSLSVTTRAQVRRRTAELQKSQALLQAVIDSAPDAVFVKNIQGKYILYNAGTAQVTGKPAEEILGYDDHVLFPDDAEAIIAHDQEIIAGGKTVTYEETLPDVDGKPRAFLTTKGPLLDKNGRRFGLFGIARDITERKRIEEELSQQSKFTITLADTMPTLMYIYDMETQSNVYSNNGIERLLGYSPQEVKDMGAELFARLIHPDDLAALIAFQPRIASAKDEDVLEIEYRIRHLNGGWRWLHSYERPFARNSDGALKQKIGFAIDITKRKQAEEKLRELNTRLVNVFESMGDAFVSLDKDWIYTYMNERAGQIFGRKPQDLVGKHIWTEFPEGVDQPFYKAYYQAVETNQPITLEEYYPPYDKWFENRICPSSAGLAIFFTDITEKKRAEIEIQRRNKELSALNSLGRDVNLSLSMDEVIFAGLNGMRNAVNPDLAFFFLRDGERLIQKSILPSESRIRLGNVPEHRVGECMCGLSVREKKAMYSRDIFNDTRCTWEECKKAGVRSFAALPLLNGGEVLGVIGLASDEERDFEAQAVFLETLTNTIAISLGNALLYEQTQQHSKELAAIHQAAQQLQVLQTPAELSQTLIRVLEKNLSYELGAVLLLDDQSNKLIPFALSEQGRNMEFVEMDKSYILSQSAQAGKGITGWVAQTGESIRLGDVRQNANYLPLRSDIRSELCVPLRIGDQIMGVVNTETSKPDAYTESDQRVLETIAAQIVVAVQNARLLEQIQGHAVELEERVRERTAQLQTANKDLESFSYSVSHDLRAPLRAISGFSEIIIRRHRASLNEEVQHYMDNITQASERMGHLIDDLLNYSRLGRAGVRRETVSLAGVFAELAKDLQGHLDKLHGAINIVAGLPDIIGDRTLLNRIFTNLLENAVTYCKADVPPQIEVGCQIEGNHVIVSVKDNGIGIPPEYQDKIFDIFQRLRPEEEYPGTGIGLATVKKSAALLGGEVWVESEVGVGSTFVVRLTVKE